MLTDQLQPLRQRDRPLTAPAADEVVGGTQVEVGEPGGPAGAEPGAQGPPADGGERGAEGGGVEGGGVEGGGVEGGGVEGGGVEGCLLYTSDAADE